MQNINASPITFFIFLKRLLTILIHFQVTSVRQPTLCFYFEGKLVISRKRSNLVNLTWAIYFPFSKVTEPLYTDIECKRE